MSQIDLNAMIKGVVNRYFYQFWVKIRSRRKQQIVELVKKCNNASKVLDCGCDDGEFTSIIKQKMGLSQIHGVEINITAAKEARNKGIEVKNSDLNYRMPYKSSYFDLIIADQVIEHLWNLDNFVSEIYRITRKGGLIIISTENLASWHNVFALALGLQPFTGPSASRKHVVGYHPLTPDFKTISKRYMNALETPEHTKVLTLTALISLLKSYGFIIEDVATSGYFPFFGTLGQLLGKIDRRHSFFITVRARKK